MRLPRYWICDVEVMESSEWTSSFYLLCLIRMLRTCSFGIALSRYCNCTLPCIYIQHEAILRVHACNACACKCDLDRHATIQNRLWCCVLMQGVSPHLCVSCRIVSSRTHALSLEFLIQKFTDAHLLKKLNYVYYTFCCVFLQEWAQSIRCLRVHVVLCSPSHTCAIGKC